MLGRKCFLLAFSAYLGLSPIFWLPYIPPALIILLKWSFFLFILVYSVLFYFNKSGPFKIELPGGQLILMLLAFMFFTLVPYAALGDNTQTIIAMVNIVQIIFFLIATNIVIEFKKVYFVLKISVWIISFFVILSVFFMFADPFFANPLKAELYIIETGFSNSRTGWGPAISLFIPFLLFFSGNLSLIFMFLVSQLLTGGRTGFYLSFLSVPIVVYLEKSLRINLRLIVILSIASLIVFLYFPSLLDNLRVIDSLNNYKGLDADTLSSGRITRLQGAWVSIIESPILGHGFHRSFLGEGVHNVFVKNWVYYGFLYFLLSIAVVVYIFVKSLKKIKSSNSFLDKKFFSILFIVLTIGFFIGMVEPSIIFGNFNTFSIWWFCFALVASDKFLLTNESFGRGWQ